MYHPVVCLPGRLAAVAICLFAAGVSDAFAQDNELSGFDKCLSDMFYSGLFENDGQEDPGTDTASDDALKTIFDWYFSGGFTTERQKCRLRFDLGLGIAHQTGNNDLNAFNQQVSFRNPDFAISGGVTLQIPSGHDWSWLIRFQALHFQIDTRNIINNGGGSARIAGDMDALMLAGGGGISVPFGRTEIQTTLFAGAMDVDFGVVGFNAHEWVPVIRPEMRWIWNITDHLAFAAAGGIVIPLAQIDGATNTGVPSSVGLDGTAIFSIDAIITY